MDTKLHQTTKFMCRNNEQQATSKGETWSPGTNLPFDANVVVKLSFQSLITTTTAKYRQRCIPFHILSGLFQITQFFFIVDRFLQLISRVNLDSDRERNVPCKPLDQRISRCSLALTAKKCTQKKETRHVQRCFAFLTFVAVVVAKVLV